MVLRRGDWETGDVICHECHLTAPPLLLPPPLSHLPPLPHLTLSLAPLTPQHPPLLPHSLSAHLSLPFTFHCNNLFEHILSYLIFLHPPSRAPSLRLSLPQYYLSFSTYLN